MTPPVFVAIFYTRARPVGLSLVQSVTLVTDLSCVGRPHRHGGVAACDRGKAAAAAAAAAATATVATAAAAAAATATTAATATRCCVFRCSHCFFF